MVDKEIILKRINILEPIYKRLNSLQDGYRQNIALIGPAGVGKSSILKYLLSSFKRPQLTFAYVNLQNQDFNYFVYKLLGSLLYNYLQEKGLIIKDDFDYLYKAAEKFLPNTCSSIKLIQQLLERRKINEAYQKTLDCVDIFTQESGKKLVLIIDEFHFLDEMGIKNAFSILGKKIMLQKAVAFIVASSRSIKANKILSEKLSLLFGNFEVITLSTLDQKTSKEFIINLVSPYQISDVYIDFIINLTAGFPLYIKVISREITRLIEKDLTAQLDSYPLIAALYNLLSKETGLLNEKFNNIIQHFSPINNEFNKGSINFTIEILVSLANGYNKISSLSKKIGTTNSRIAPRLNKLCQEELVSKNASFYKIIDPMFELWLRLIFTKKLNRIDDDELGFKNQFSSQISKMLEVLRFEANREFLERIEEVFKQFRDESIIFDRRKLKIEKFDEVKTFNFDSDPTRKGVLGRNAQNVWVTALKAGDVCENDIHEFVCECKKFKEKHLKKLLISLGEVDLNASLLAKEEKILTWNLGHLNLLLNLFGKPKIIRY